NTESRQFTRLPNLSHIPHVQVEEYLRRTMWDLTEWLKERPIIEKTTLAEQVERAQSLRQRLRYAEIDHLNDEQAAHTSRILQTHRKLCKSLRPGQRQKEKEK